MKVTLLEIPDILLIEPKVFGDDRGFFFESYNQRAFQDCAGIDETFVQDNHSRSVRGVLRGLHYQLVQPQSKLVRVIQGDIFDVAVDIRKRSPTFGKWVGRHLSADSKNMMWIPKGFAHGFVVLSDVAEVLYKTTDFYHPGSEKSVLWNDPDINIAWPFDFVPNLSAKDSQGASLKTAELFA